MIGRVIRRRRRAVGGTLEQLASETSELVGRLLRENRTLRAENAVLKQEVERLSRTWEEIQRLVKVAPRRRRSRNSSR
jgi:hypothetical protein